MSRLIRSLVLCSLLAGLTGCPSDFGKDPNQNHYLRLSVRVLNGETQLPLSGVTFKVCDFEATASTDGDGHAFIEIIPGISGTTVRVTLERSGFASLGTNVGVFPDTNVFEGNLQERQFIDLGTMWMRPGEPVTAHVTRDGAPLSGAVLYAAQSEFAYDGTGLGDCSDLFIVGTTNASGVATMNNFDPTQFYEFVVPTQDVDGDGIPDIRTATSGLRIVDDGSIIAINTETLGPDTGPEITGTNLASFDNSFSVHSFTAYSGGIAGVENQTSPEVNFQEGVVTANGSVQIVFWNPVSITGANFRYRNNMVPVTDPDFNTDLRISATATALAGSDSTIFNIVPLTPLPPNEVVTLNFIARSTVDTSQSQNISLDIYVPLHLGALVATIDNYNGSRDRTVGSTATYLRFAEAVEGFYKVIAFTVDGSTTTFENVFPQTLGDFSPFDDIIFNQDAAPATGSTGGPNGATVGTDYRMLLRDPHNNTLFLPDDTVALGSTVTIEISARNIVGTTLDGIFTLPVQ